jgi:hypothetical protein
LGSPADEDISSTITPCATPAKISQGPMTRARTRQINCEVLSLLNTYDLTSKNMVPPSSVDLLVIRNEGIGEWSREDQVETQVDKEEGETIQASAHNTLASSRQASTSSTMGSLKPRKRAPGPCTLLAMQ